MHKITHNDSCIIIESIHCGVHDNSVDSEEFPVISSVYITQGTLYIPYAEVEETFSAWVDLKNGQSRIDFYGGLVFALVLIN